MKLLVPAFIALFLGACEPKQSATIDAVQNPVTVQAAEVEKLPADSNAITAEGWGPLKIGMTRAEVAAAVGPTATPNAVGGPEPELCDLFHPARAPEGMLVMIQKDMLTSITVRKNNILKTDRGFGVGDQASEIKSAYGAALQASPHKYLGSPAEYITEWRANGPPNSDSYTENPAARGIRYETDLTGRVTAVHAGGPSIQNVEGCS